MKVAIGYHLQEGPWGGGNQFAHSLAAKLREAGHQVCFGLGESCWMICVFLLKLGELS